MVGGIFARGGYEQILVGEGDLYICIIHIYIYKRLCQQVFIYNDEAFCTSHTSCAEVAILLLQDLNTLCVTYIYMVCIFTYLFSVRDTIHISHHEHF